MSKADISHWIFRFLKWFCPNHLYEEIEGDLLQMYHRDIRCRGGENARWRLLIRVILFFRPGLLLRNRFVPFDQNFMFKNYTRLAFRQAERNKIVSGINIVGLTLAITVCLLITQFALFEHSFEQFNKNGDRTYRINLYNNSNGVHTSTSAQTVPGLAYGIRETIPGVESIARVSTKTRAVVSNGDRKFVDREDNIVFADHAIIDVLSLEFVDGNKAHALKNPQSVIISESIAKKYFGTVTVAGRILGFGFNNNSLGSTPYQIEGVIKDTPLNSHRSFEIILPPVDEQAWNGDWSWSDVTTYLVLPPSISPSDLDSGLAEIVKTHHKDGRGDRYLLEPITEIRLHAIDGTGRASIVNFFVLLGAAIMLLAWFNYTNLATARFLERLKEIGVRKVIGATRLQLVTQFLMESVLFNLIAFSASVILFFICWPVVSAYLEQNVPVTLFDNPKIFFYGVGFLFSSSLLSGLYPSLFLSSFKPLPSLKGIANLIVDRTTLRKVIVTVQLSVSIALVTAVIAIQRQVEFMRSQDLGISIEQTLIIEEAVVTEAKSIEKYETAKNEMLNLAAVQGVTNASTFAGREIDWHRTDITLGEENATYKFNSRIIAIGSEFLDVFHIELVAGRNFNPTIESDKKAMLISEDASTMFGFRTYRDALGKLIYVGARKFEVIGVTKNYHYRALQSKIEPLLFMQSYPRGPAFAIKISPGKVEETISQLKTIWENAYTGNVFRYYFMDEFYDRQYTAETQAVNIISVLTVFAIVIACSGLFALSMYSVGRRAKEISIRKVFGASVRSVVVLLSRDLFILTIVGGLLSIPIMYFGVDEWLNGYAYKMPLNGWMFLLPVLTVITLVLITISFQTLAAARRNPVENMRYE